MSKPPLSDAQLVQNALQNLESFADIMERYEHQLKIYILRISNISDLEAEEILQEVFIKAWKNLNDFDQTLKLSTWLYRITHNEVISNYRKLKSRGEDIKPEFDDEFIESVADEFNFIEEFDKRINTETVREILAQLPEKYREVLVLKFIEDKSYDEIADILQKPPGTIATLINRAKSAFKDIVERQQIKL